MIGGTSASKHSDFDVDNRPCEEKAKTSEDTELETMLK